MSQVYATEPTTSGRVLMETTHGPLELQLWCRECPTTTRFFLQLCLDGFFDNMVFHRIVPDFLIQTGAMRVNNSQEPKRQGSSTVTTSSSALGTDYRAYRVAVQADEALQRRKYEIHSRLRFSHRGQIAMALGVADDDDVDLQPQFFVTLEEAPYLDGKHVLFGTISGPTIFNAIRMGRTLVEETTSQPIDLEDAPCIKSVKIVENPLFPNLKAQATVPWRAAAAPRVDEKKSKRKKRKGKKDVNVLSFGNELEDALESGNARIQSSHDVVASEALSRQVDNEVEEAVHEASMETQASKNKDKITANEEKAPLRHFDTGIVKAPSAPPPAPDGALCDSPSDTGMQRRHVQSLSDRAAPERIHQTTPVEEHLGQKVLSAVEARRAKYKRKAAGNKKQREEDTMNKLLAFQRKVKMRVSDKANAHDDGTKDNSLAARMAMKAEANTSRVDVNEKMAPTYHGQVLDDDDDKGAEDWMNTMFKCRKHIDLTAGGKDDTPQIQSGEDGRDMDDYAVIDEKRGGAKDHHHHRKRPKHRSSHRGKHSVKNGHNLQR